MPSEQPPSTAGNGADILELLRRDHRRVDGLLDQIEATDDDDERRRAQLFAQVTAELEVHSDAEDQVVYTCFETSSDLEELIEVARQEHEHIEQMVEELDRTDLTSSDWLDKVRELRQLVRHHVDQEESGLFERIRAALDAGARERLGQDFAIAKESEEAEVTVEPAASAAQPADDLDIESMSKKELYELARRRHIEGRSAMTKAQLVSAIRGAG